jgi:Flp pilus assembly pilin Flp
MIALLVRTKWLGRDGELGQGLIEYAMLAVLVSIAAISIVGAIGGYLPHLFAIPLNAL